MAPIDALADLGLEAHPLLASDGGDALALSMQAGWNQNLADWHYMVGHGLGWGVRDGGGGLAATALVLPYDGDLAWICMVLVRQTWQRRGIATALLREAVERRHLVVHSDGVIDARYVKRTGLGTEGDRISVDAVYVEAVFRAVVEVTRRATIDAIDLFDLPQFQGGSAAEAPPFGRVSTP